MLQLRSSVVGLKGVGAGLPFEVMFVHVYASMGDGGCEMEEIRVRSGKCSGIFNFCPRGENTSPPARR